MKLSRKAWTAKKSPARCEAWLVWLFYQCLQLDNIRSCRAFWAIDNLELNARALIKGFESVSLDCRIMDENVIAIVLFDKAETFGRIKPLYCSFVHF